MKINVNKKSGVLLGLTAVLMLAALVIGCKTNVSTPETFAVTFGVAGQNGSLKAKADGIAETDKSPITVEKGKTVTFTAYPASGYEVDKWTVNGTVITNTATTYSHKVTAKTDVKVLFKASAVAVIDVMLDKTKLTLEEEKTEQLTATVTPANATNKTVAWSSDKPAIASVDKNGTVTAHKAGEAVIIVTTEDGGKTASCKVNVTAKPPTTYKVTFSVDGTGGTLKAKADGVTETDKSPISVEKDKTVTFTATANTGYKVDKWSISGSSFESGSGADGSITAKVKVTANTTVNVTFKQQAVTPPPPPASVDKTYAVGGISFTMKEIAAVTNGSVGDNSQSDNNVHTVSLTAYRIGESEVTQELWQAVMSNNPSYYDGTSGKEPVSGETQEKRPVESVNWYECIAFCNELTKKVAGLGESECLYYSDAGYTNVYTKEDAGARKAVYLYTAMNKKGFRLPTEAEWEWAAKGGTEYKWAGTDEADKLKDYAWYSANSNNQTHEVKKQTANGYGLYDMSGNVWEWCWDWYSNSTPTGGQDPTGPAASGAVRVMRGGSWRDNAGYCVVGRRYGVYPDSSYVILGLRLAMRP